MRVRSFFLGVLAALCFMGALAAFGSGQVVGGFVLVFIGLRLVRPLFGGARGARRVPGGFDGGHGRVDGGQFVLFGLVASALNEILKVHGAGSAERTHAERLLVELSDGMLTLEHARQVFDNAPPFSAVPNVITEQMPAEIRYAFLRLAVEVALVDGTVTRIERDLLLQLAARLRVPADAVDALIGLLGHGATATQQNDMHRACDTLGVAHDADIGTIRAAYRKLIRKHHPDRFPEGQFSDADRAAATERTSEINAAYDLLVGARTA